MSLQNERALVGSAVLNPSITELMPEVDSKLFADDTMGVMWSVIRQLNEDGAVDPLLVQKQMQLRGYEISTAEIGKIFTEVPHPGHADFYKRNVLESNRLRELRIIRDQLTDNLSDRTVSSSEIVSQLIASIETVSSADVNDRPVCLADALDDLVDALDSNVERKSLCEFGIGKIDDCLGGMAPGEMIVVGARPSCGKSALGLQVAMHNSTVGKQVLFCALEMTVEEMAKRIVTSNSDVTTGTLRARNTTSAERKMILDLVGRIRDAQLDIYSTASLTIQKLKSVSKQRQMRTGLDLIIIDYLGLMKSTQKFGSKRWEIFTEISNQLKQLAIDLGIPIIVLQQLGRQTDGRPPRLSDLRDSGSVEQDADVVILIDYPEKTQANTDDVKLDVAKNRHGPTGFAPCKFIKEMMRFEVPKPKKFAEFC